MREDVNNLISYATLQNTAKLHVGFFPRLFFFCQAVVEKKSYKLK
jgi:hypothetical protein